MAKTFTIIVYITISILLLLLLTTRSPPRHSPRRLKLRPIPSTPHPPIPFDPIISSINQRLDDRQWERTHFAIPPANHPEPQPDWEDLEDYINDEDRFNITHRIQLLFPLLDVRLKDGFISVEELTEWNLQTAAKEVMHRTERDMELHDKNHDGFVEFTEYEAPVWARKLDGEGDGKWGWWREDHFNASDVDGDGLLNKTEFNDFLHPADSENPKLIHWLCEEEIRERDKDKDGKLSFQEFFSGLFDSIRNYDDDHNQSDSDAPAKKLFAQLDLDNDGFLTPDEIKPVIGNLHPSERFYAKQQADYVLQQADSDSDGRLSLKEMIEHPYVFYNSIFNDEDDEGYHDEFR